METLSGLLTSLNDNPMAVALRDGVSAFGGLVNDVLALLVGADLKVLLAGFSGAKALFDGYLALMTSGRTRSRDSPTGCGTGCARCSASTAPAETSWTWCWRRPRRGCSTGKEVLYQLNLRWTMEATAYAKEITLARRAGDLDLVRELEALRLQEWQRIFMPQLFQPEGI